MKRTQSFLVYGDIWDIPAARKLVTIDDYRRYVNNCTALGLPSQRPVRVTITIETVKAKK